MLDANLEGSPGSIGLFLGDGSQSNYISLSLSDTGLVLVEESNNTATVQEFTVDNMDELSVADLQLSFDPAAGTVLPSVRLEGNPLEILGTPRPLSSALTNLLQNSSAPAVGLLADNPTGAGFSATWDSLNVTFNNGATCQGTWSTLDDQTGQFQALSLIHI